MLALPAMVFAQTIELPAPTEREATLRQELGQTQFELGTRMLEIIQLKKQVAQSGKAADPPPPPTHDP